MKKENEWREDNGVPTTARYYDSSNVLDVIKKINGLLKSHGVRVKTKHRRGHGTGAYIWVEKR